MLQVNWSEIKNLIDAGTVEYRHIELSNKYIVNAFDGDFKLQCSFYKGGDEATEYEASYKTVGADLVKKEITSQAFANKHTTDGKSLYARETGVAGVTIAAGATVDIVHTITFPAVKINGAQIYGCQLGDTVNFKVKDSTAGTYTTVPNYLLNQFGFNVNMPSGSYSKQYPYDADLYTGMQVVAEYTNNGSESITVYVNLDIHEVK